MDKTRVLLQLVFFVSRTHCLLATTCPQHLRQSPRPSYHLTKECAYASTMRTVASSNATALDSCVQLAMAKNAFAFSYANQTGDTNTTLSSTCNVYECPEFHSFLLLDRMSVYDYYSLFSKPLPTENYTCAPGVGMFEMVTDRLNYSNAMIACEEAGGHLANIASDSRTSFLSSMISSALINKTVTLRKAFVGLFYENDFVAVTGHWPISTESLPNTILFTDDVSINFRKPPATESLAVALLSFINLDRKNVLHLTGL